MLRGSPVLDPVWGGLMGLGSRPVWMPKTHVKAMRSRKGVCVCLHRRCLVNRPRAWAKTGPILHVGPPRAPSWLQPPPESVPGTPAPPILV